MDGNDNIYVTIALHPLVVTLFADEIHTQMQLATLPCCSRRCRDWKLPACGCGREQAVCQRLPGNCPRFETVTANGFVLSHISIIRTICIGGNLRWRLLSRVCGGIWVCGARELGATCVVCWQKEQLLEELFTERNKIMQILSQYCIASHHGCGARLIMKLRRISERGRRGNNVWKKRRQPQNNALEWLLVLTANAITSRHLALAHCQPQMRIGRRKARSILCIPPPNLSRSFVGISSRTKSYHKR